MTREGEWRKEWEVLRAERALARRRWRSAADGLSARARDPLGLGRLVHDHPVAATGIGAAAGALLMRLFAGGGRARGDGESRDDGPARQSPSWPAALRDAALDVAVPWLLRALKGDPDPAQEPERENGSGTPS